MSSTNAVDERLSDDASAAEGAVFGECPLPIFDHPQIVLGHGSGGKLSEELIEKVFVRRFSNPALEQRNDSALLEIGGARLAFTTDSFVVTPIFFPGGDIGSLAVNGTVNDLAMAGAKPLYLSAAFILEEGLLASDLTRVVDSMQAAATRAGVQVVTGDTKVVNRGKGDQIFIATTGIGQVAADVSLSASRAQPGDKILLSGYIGDHGITILSQRENLEFEGDLRSDCAALNSLVDVMMEEARAAGTAAAIRCLRDPTRGGVASTLNEIAKRAGVGMMLQEEEIPVRDTVRGACEMLGLDPLFVANEGKLLAVVSAELAPKILQRMQSHPLGRESRMVGQVLEGPQGMVLMKTTIGGTRVVDTLFGEQLPPHLLKMLSEGDFQTSQNHPEGIAGCSTRNTGVWTPPANPNRPGSPARVTPPWREDEAYNELLIQTNLEVRATEERYGLQFAPYSQFCQSRSANRSPHPVDHRRA